MLKVLFDHCAPRPLRRKFGAGIKATEAQAEGLDRTRNSALEKKAHELGYYSLITVDTDFGKPHLAPKYIPVVLLRGYPSAAPPTLAALMPEVERALLSGKMKAGLYIWCNFYDRIYPFRSFAESEALRKELKQEKRKL